MTPFDKVSTDRDADALAQRVRDACVRAAVEAYEDAGVRGLCAEGRWEFAVDAVRRLDLASLVSSARAGVETGVGKAPAGSSERPAT